MYMFIFTQEHDSLIIYLPPTFLDHSSINREESLYGGAILDIYVDLLRLQLALLT